MNTPAIYRQTDASMALVRAVIDDKDVESLRDEIYRLLASIAEREIRHDARVTELLAHNSELIERARVAERRCADLEHALLASAYVAGEIGRIMINAGHQ